MRIAFWLAGLAGSLLAPYAAAQTVVDPQLDHTPVLTATFTQTDTLVTGRVRQRVASQMADFYPMDGSGFHLSAGLRMFEGRSMLRQNMKAMRDLVYLPYSRSNSGVHWGYRRVAAVTMGYTQSFDEDVSVGIEAGAMMGRALSRGGRRLGSGSGEGDGRRNGGPNSIVHLVLNVNF